jgi:hypothetical protein
MYSPVSQVLRVYEMKNLTSISSIVISSRLEYNVKEATMNEEKKAQKADLKKRMLEETLQKKEAEAEHRRQLLASLSPKTREMARRDFAKLGLYQ